VITTINRVGPRHDERELLAGAVAAALDGGLAELTFGRLAKRLGINDRMLVYYFTNKDGLLEAVLGELTTSLVGRLEVAFGDAPATPTVLLRRAWPVLTDAESDRIFAVWFELAGLAAAGHQPHRTLAELTVAGMLDWLATRVDGPTPTTRRRAAETLIAVMDGALLLHHLGQRDVARRVVTSYR
jgi:AcrR family transcriptional regulator